MKRSLVGMYLAGALLLSVVTGGCDNPRQQFVSPTAPSIAASSSLLSEPSQNSHSLPPDLVFNVLNPCTDSPVTLRRHTVKFVYHENLDATGGGHFAVTSVIEITTSDGFSGPETVTTGGNFGAGRSGVQEQRFTDSQTASDGSGRQVVVHGVMQVVFKDGVPVVEYSVLSLECRGKPVA
jgi:hypothetical protein